MVHMGCEKEHTIDVGPWGGPGGNPWDDGTYDGVREITVTSSTCIDSIQVAHEKNCKPIVAQKHGGSGGHITSQESATNGKNQIPQQKGCQNDQNTIVVGLLGGPGGSKWDDGSYDGVREIILKYGSCIDSMQVVYEKNFKPVYAEKHGGNGGANTAQIKLQSPEEFFTTVSGHYSPRRSGNSLVRSLTFKTNWRTFGPFGVEEGTPFSLEGGRIVGLKGSSGRLLDAIGFYIAPFKKM